jgi:hypothetical protein
MEEWRSTECPRHAIAVPHPRLSFSTRIGTRALLARPVTWSGDRAPWRPRTGRRSWNRRRGAFAEKAMLEGIPGKVDGRSPSPLASRPPARRGVFQSEPDLQVVAIDDQPDRSCRSARRDPRATGPVGVPIEKRENLGVGPRTEPSTT